MLTIMTAMALAGAAQTTPANATAQPKQMGEMQGMDMSQMDHSKMEHMSMGQYGDGCCTHSPDGKMECAMDKKSGASAHEGHSSH